MARLLTSALLLLSVHLCFSANLKAAAPPKRVHELDVSEPGFCKGLECPSFTVLHTSESYEERQYAESKWVSTEVMSMDYDSATSEGFDKLFHYIDGHNEARQKIEMTAPVATRVIPGQGPACESNFTISFFLPAAHRDSPPTPSDSTVFFSTFPAHRAYVRSFGGFASQSDWISAASELAVSLDASHTYDSSYYYTAGYDSPFTFLHRHNEVWFIAN